VGELAEGARWPGVDLEVRGEGGGGRAGEFVEAGRVVSCFVEDVWIAKRGASRA